MNDESFGVRLRNARKALGLTLEEFGTPLGSSKGAVSRWENEATNPPKITCLAIEYIHGIAAHWLLTGEGSMQALRAPAEGWLHGETIERPIIIGSPTCGPGGQIEDPGPDAPRFPLRRDFVGDLLRTCGGGSERTLFLTQCRGESMRPTIHDGDLVLVNASEQLRLRPLRDAIYLVRQEPGSNDAMVKRVRMEEGQVVFSSDAPGYRSISVPIDGVTIQSLILGRVCWVARNVLSDEGPGRW